jgi:hypothetical protein
MSILGPDFLEQARTVFRDATVVSLQAVRDLVAAEALTTQRRDTLSAIDTFGRLIGRPLVDIAASPPIL